jgi:hypothetical protein
MRSPIRHVNARRIFIGKIGKNDGAAFRGEQLQGLLHDVELEICMARRPKRAPQLERNPERTRIFDPLGMQPDQTDRDRRHALRLEIVAERAHGARAEGSNGGQ